MKKLISLLLVLALSLGMLTGICLAADKPAECSEAEAGICLTFSGSSDKFYFETMTNALLKWACLEMPGAPTFTLLKDLEITNPNEGSSRLFTMASANAEWYGSARPNTTGKLPVTFDLGGKTMKYEGSAAMFRMDRYGATFKNGTIIYNLTAKGRPMFVSGGSNANVATSNGSTVYAPEIVLENMVCLATGEGGIFYSYNYATKLTATDSVLWSNNATAINFLKSTQETEGYTAYTGAYEPTVTLKNCVVGSSSDYPVRSTEEPGAKVIATDTVLVSGRDTILKSGNAVTLDIAQQIKEDAAWTLEVAGQTLAGKAFIAGKDPNAIELPFTDVKEGDWFYSFVAEMYGKKIIAGQTATTFNPNGNLTYGAALKLLTVGVLGKDAGNASSGHWATNYLNEAVSAGWTTVGADKLDAPVTREAFCEIAAKAKNLTEKAENPFKDTTNDAVLALVKAGVISGMSADTFNPTGVLTRAQIAKIISLLIKL